MQEARKIHVCECPDCVQSEDHPDKVLYRQMNVFLSRLNEQAHCACGLSNAPPFAANPPFGRDFATCGGGGHI